MFLLVNITDNRGIGLLSADLISLFRKAETPLDIDRRERRFPRLMEKLLASLRHDTFSGHGAAYGGLRSAGSSLWEQLIIVILSEKNILWTALRQLEKSS